MAVAVAGALRAGLLPESVPPYLGLSPLAPGLHAAWRLWRERHDQDHDGMTEPAGPGALSVAAVTFANGGDNIGVYVPAFTQSSSGGLATYVGVFAVLVAVWCAAGLLPATRPTVARALARRATCCCPWY
jgi:cadmium resistance protein CadD (predicted permease)